MSSRNSDNSYCRHSRCNIAFSKTRNSENKGPFWNYCLLVLLGGFVNNNCNTNNYCSSDNGGGRRTKLPIPNVLCTTGVDAARAILKNASTEAPAVATKSVTKTGITAVGILTPTFAGSSSQQKL